MPFDPRNEAYEVTEESAVAEEPHEEAQPQRWAEEPRTAHEKENGTQTKRPQEKSGEANRQLSENVKVTFDSDEVLDKLGNLAAITGFL